MPFNRPIPKSSPKSRPDPRPDPARGSKISGGLASLVEAEKMIQISVLLPCSAFVGWAFGAILDRLIHTSWIGMVGIIFGGISGIVYVVRMVTAGSKPRGGSASGGSGPNS